MLNVSFIVCLLLAINCLEYFMKFELIYRWSSFRGKMAKTIPLRLLHDLSYWVISYWNENIRCAAVSPAVLFFEACGCMEHKHSLYLTTRGFFVLAYQLGAKGGALVYSKMNSIRHVMRFMKIYLISE